MEPKRTDEKKSFESFGRRDDREKYSTSLFDERKLSLNEFSSLFKELDQITKSIDEPLENFCEQNLQILNDEIDDALWVEKFAPKAFCDLLSDIVSCSY